jgi:hypothetical protein
MKDPMLEPGFRWVYLIFFLEELVELSSIGQGFSHQEMGRL